MKENTAKSKKNSGKITIIFCLIFLVITCTCIFAATAYKSITIQNDSNMSLVSSMNNQANTGIENYRSKIEGIAKNFFSQTSLIQYDATKFNESHYQRSQTEREINLQLNSLAFLDDFASFGIIYRNNNVLGTVDEKSLHSLDSQQNSAYDTAEKILGGGNQVWYATPDRKSGQIFFLKRANENAVFIASFYKSNLDNIFSESLINRNLKIYITDSNQNVIYCTNKNTFKLNDDIKTAFNGDENNVASDYHYTAAKSTCFDNWNTFTILDMNEQLAELKKMIVIFIAMLFTSVIIFLFILFFINLNRPAEEPLTIPEAVDTLTGLSNAESAENLIEDKIEKCATGSSFMLALVEITNISLIRENYGKEGVEEALLKTSEALKNFYQEDTIIGKVGENEFAVFADFTQYDLFAVHSNIKTNLNELETALGDISLDNNRGQIKISAGAAIYPDDSSDYDELYEYAKKALEKCKADERGQYVLYQQEKK